MSNKQQRLQPTVVPAGADDLQTIDGIGPGIESRLYSANIHTYAQLADLSPSEIAPLVAGIAGMSIDRIIKQDWIGQARRLLPQGSDSQQFATSTAPVDQELLSAQEETQSPVQHHPYATFTVELLLDDDNNVRRTRAKHVQGGTEDSWAGWHATRLTDSLIRQGSLRMPSQGHAELVAELAEVTLPVEQSMVVGAELAAQATEVEQSMAIGAELAAETTEADEALAVAPPAPIAEAPATVRLYGLGLSSAGTTLSRHMLRAGQSFAVDLALDIAAVTVPADLPLRYLATLSAKKVGAGQRLTLGEANGTILANDSPSITIECIPLLRGIYRLEATVTLKLPDRIDATADTVSALLEGNMIQVY